jgi:hypothetical protein
MYPRNNQFISICPAEPSFTKARMSDETSDNQPQSGQTGAGYTPVSIAVYGFARGLVTVAACIRRRKKWGTRR